MKKKLILTLAVLLTSSLINSGLYVSAASNIAAFPGAEGGGKYATGGRGGEIYYVTNLNDSGVGSFRDAVSRPNRIVLFKVGGTIELKSDVVINSNITIAGQTAYGTIEHLNYVGNYLKMGPNTKGEHNYLSVDAFPSGTVTTSPKKNSTSNTNSNTNANSTINYSIN